VLDRVVLAPPLLDLLHGDGAVPDTGGGFPAALRRGRRLLLRGRRAGEPEQERNGDC
jgi:hypothetical protein